MRILCTLPNASKLISGVPFEPHPDGGMVSAGELDGEQAQIFLSIAGFSAIEDAAQADVFADPVPDAPQSKSRRNQA